MAGILQAVRGAAAGRKRSNGMEIRRLTQDEKACTRGLYEEVFPEDSREFVDYYYTEKTKDNVIYAAEEDKKIRGMLHLNPYVLSVNGSERKVNYIVAVATQRDYRRRGYMAALLRHVLQSMYEAGQSFTFLMPAAERIYLPHDFRTVYEQEKRYYEEGKSEYPMTQAGEEDCEKLAEAANRYLGGNYQVFAKRDAAYYQRLLKEYASDGGALMIRREDGEITDCRVFMPDGAEKEKPKIMVRIVDVRRMLMVLKVKSLTAVCFHITDPVIEENNRCIVFMGTEFSGVMLMDGKPENSEGTVTIAALASFLFGAKNAEEICEEEGVFLSERMKEEMRKIIPLSKIYLNETV